MSKKLNAGSSSSDVKKGLEVLDQFWKSGYRPDDLERHYFFTWFALSDGRILRAVKKMGIHRNTFQNYLAKMRLSHQAIKLRRVWESLEDGKGEKTFNSRLLDMYKKMKSKPNITPAQSAALVGLWKSGFPNKMMMPHFVLWATRSGKSREWVQKELDFSLRHTIRVLARIANPKTDTAFWLSPIKPTAKEIYKPRYYSRLK